MKLSGLFFIVGITIYTVTSKLFPEKISNKNSKKDLRGGDLAKYHLIRKIVKKITHDPALKIALISVFTTAGIPYFHQEIESLLVDDVFNHVCVKKVDGQLRIICYLIKDHELDLHAGSMKELIVANNLSQEDKINFLKIKLLLRVKVLAVLGPAEMA